MVSENLQANSKSLKHKYLQEIRIHFSKLCLFYNLAQFFKSSYDHKHYKMTVVSYIFTLTITMVS
jgi:hypothetical protein